MSSPPFVTSDRKSIPTPRQLNPEIIKLKNRMLNLHPKPVRLWAYNGLGNLWWKAMLFSTGLVGFRAEGLWALGVLAAVLVFSFYSGAFTL